MLDVQVLASLIFLGKLFHTLIMRIKKECLKLFKVADTDLSSFKTVVSS